MPTKIVFSKALQIYTFFSFLQIVKLKNLKQTSIKETIACHFYFLNNGKGQTGLDVSTNCPCVRDNHQNLISIIQNIVAGISITKKYYLCAKLNFCDE